MSHVIRLNGWLAACALVVSCSAGGRGNAGTSPVVLLISSNAAVKATSTQLLEGTRQLVKDWNDAKTRVEEIHTQRVAELRGIEADLAFLEEAAKTLGAGADPGRLKKLLGITDTMTLEQEVERALGPAARPRDPARYFEYLQTMNEQRARQNDVGAVTRFNAMWADLSRLTGEPIQTGKEMSEWVKKQRGRSWDELLNRFERKDASGRVVADGVAIVRTTQQAAADLKLDFPTGAARYPEMIRQLQQQREQFVVVDSLLGHLLTIARDLDTFLQNDVEAIHWKDVGRAGGQVETLANEVKTFGGGR